jgi:hypothetical protein
VIPRGGIQAIEVWIRQEADLLGFALMVNSITLARHRERVAAAA